MKAEVLLATAAVVLGLVAAAQGVTYTEVMAASTFDHPDLANLLYDPATGNVKMDASEAAGSVILSFQIETAGLFREGNYIGPAVGGFGGAFEDINDWEIGDTDLTFTGFGGVHDFGDIFPAGMNSDQLDGFLTKKVYTGAAGTGQWDLDLLVVPEPASLLILLAAGLPALLKRRRSRS